MALIIADRVFETTTTTGTGTYTLAGAKTGFQSFAAVGNGNTTYYACTDGVDYEVGLGTYTASGTTLARTTIIESSNSDAAVNWGAGEKSIFVTLPASKALVQDASDAVTQDGDLTVTGNLTVQGTTITVDSATAQNIVLGDNDKMTFGAGSDLQIYHDASDSIINDNGTGSLKLQTGGSTKLEVTSTGIDVTGTVTADGLTVDGNVSLNGGTSATIITFDANRSGAGFQISGLLGKWNGTNAANIGIYTGSDTTNKDDGVVKIQTSEFLGTLRDRALFDANGDISFYEDQGITPKFVWKAADERLGIGTSLPNGTLTVRNNSTNTEQLILGNSLNTGGRDWRLGRDNAASGDFIIKYSDATNSNVTTEAMRISSGNVGIGTNGAPTFTAAYGGLHVHSTYPEIHLTGTDSGSGASDGFKIQKNSANHVYLWNYENAFMAFATNNTERMRINSDGSVHWKPDGTTQDMTLDASGNLLVGTTASQSGLAKAAVQFDSGSQYGLEIKDAGSGTTGTFGIFYRGSTVVGTIGVASSGGTFDISGAANNVRITGGNASYWVTSGAFYGGTANTRDLGTSTFKWKNLYLSNGVYGNANALKFSTDAGTTQHMTLDTSGNLLVGHTSTYSPINNGGNGVTLSANGEIFAGSSQSSGVMLLNRENSDGTILTFRKDGTTVGSIGSRASVVSYIALDPRTVGVNGAGLTGGSVSSTIGEILPTDGSGAVDDDAVNLGDPSYRFKNLYLSGGVYGNANALKFSTDAGTTQHMTLDTSGNLLVGKTSAGYATDGFEARAAGYASVSDTDTTPFLVNRNGIGDGNLIAFYKAGATVGSIGTNGGDVYIGTGDTGVRFVDSLDCLLPLNTSTNATRDAAIDIGYNDGGRFKDLYLSGGVYLGGTGAANKLDDYEEGTWTPVIRGNSSAGSATYATQTGTYTKVGRTVTFEFAVVWSGHTGTGSIEIGGFPFNAGTQTYYLVQTENISLTSGSISFTSRIDASDNYGLLIQTPTGGGVRAAVPMDAAGDIRGVGTYQTA